MSILADNDKWVVADSDREFLTRAGANPRQVILAAGFADGAPMWRIGEVAGYGAGRSSDPEKRRHSWVAAVSRAAKDSGSIVPRIQHYINLLKHFRTHGEGPQIADEREILQALSATMRSSSDSQVVSSAKALLESYRRDGGQRKVTAKQVVKLLITRVGPVRAKLVLELYGCTNLILRVPELFEGVEYDPRLTKLIQELLEDGNEQSRPVARRAGDDTRNLDSGGLRRDSDDAAGKMDRGLENAGGAGAGQRRDGIRDVEERIGKLEKLKLEARL